MLSEPREPGPGPGELVELTRPRPGVALVTLNRPAKANALSKALLAQLYAALVAADDEHTRVVVLAGRGRTFSAGGDVSEMAAALADLGPRAGSDAYLAAYRPVVATLRAMDAVVIAAIEGNACGGGFELACLCDLRVVTSGSTLWVGDLDMGLPPGCGLTYVLPRLVGLGRANWLTLAEPRVGGEQAVAIGLADEVVPTDAVARALDIAERMAANPGRGLGLARSALRYGVDAGPTESIAFEERAFALAAAEPDARAAIEAW